MKEEEEGGQKMKERDRIEKVKSEICRKERN